jgi:hypothetical protein
MYKAINGWTKKRIIDQIYQRNNGFASRNKWGECLYRNENNACPIGCFIPDKVYHENMEGQNVTSLLNEWPVITDFMPLPGDALLELQELHDNNNDHDDVRLALKTWIETNVEEI